MNSTFQQKSNINDKEPIDDCCCCCCCCDCYYEYYHPNTKSKKKNSRKRYVEEQSQKQQKQKQKQISVDEFNRPLPPWISDSSLVSNCSCCSSVIEKEDFTDNDQNVSSLPSTECTTPDFTQIQKDEENLTPDLEKLRKKKIHAIDELLQTERDYVDDLSYLVDICLDTLNNQSWITLEHKSIICRNSKDILGFHKQFITHYDINNDNNWSLIAKSFLDQIEQFSLYKNYCDLHADAWTLISEYRDRPEWANFLKDCTLVDSTSNENKLQQQKKLHFEDYLIKPVQRICRYQLLIKEIIRYTSSQAAEYDLWNVVLSEMQDVVSEIDDRKLQRDIKERTSRFIDRLDGDWRITKSHVSELGNLIVAGAIEVTYSALGQSVSKPRYLGCFVFQTYIIMVRPKKVTNYEPKHWFPLRMADFEDLQDIEGQREHSFVVRCKKHTFAFRASCSQEKQLWVKKLQEAIVAAKIEASDENLLAQDFIVSSLPGITSKRSPQSIRLSRSFTNILDMTIAGNHALAQDTPKKSLNTMDRKQLRRSASATIHFEEIMKLSMQTDEVVRPDVTLKKRHSADYAFNRKSRHVGLKPRNNSEMYIKPDLLGVGLPRRRPSSLDLLSAANNNVIGKMSFQLKNNHQNALRVTVDHKLRDVSTQDYLSSRAWHMRDRDQSSFSFESLTSQNNNQVSNNSNTGSNQDLLKKRKSSSFIRSASSFSLIIPKRASELKQSNRSSLQQHVQSEFVDADSNISSSSSSMERSLSNLTKTDQKNTSDSRRPSQSSQVYRRLSQNRGFMSESYESFSSQYSINKHLERSPSKKQLFVGKVLRRIVSLHQKFPSPPSYDSKSSFDEYEIKKAASVETKSNKWDKHEEVVQLKVGDLPILNNQNFEETEKPTTTISAFSYASTPPPSNLTSLKGNNKWKSRLSLIRPTSFLKLNGTQEDSTAFY